MNTPLDTLHAQWQTLANAAAEADQMAEKAREAVAHFEAKADRLWNESQQFRDTTYALRAKTPTEPT